MLFFIPGYTVTSNILLGDASNPLNKTVAAHLGGWIINYFKYPSFMIAPISGFSGAFATVWLAGKQFYRLALICSAICLFGIIATVGLSMFPFILPSSTHPDMSLLYGDASSSHQNLVYYADCHHHFSAHYSYLYKLGILCIAR